VGVCHPRLRFVRPGPRLTRDDIRTFEDRNAIRLPDAYAGLLMNFNGGTPSRRRVGGVFRRSLGSFRMLAPSGWSPAVGGRPYPLPLAGVLSDDSPTAGQVIEFADDRATGGYFIGVAPGVIYHAKDRDPGCPLWESAGFYSIAPSLPELLAAVG
jgi:hypothetical protein